MGRLDDRTALVTGGARGIGRGIALELAKEGADVIIGDLLFETAEATAGEIRALGRRAMAVEMDVTSEDSIESAVERARAELGDIQILVNNAGVAPDHLSQNEVESDWDRCFEVNLKAIWKVSSALVPHLKEQGGGKIVNIASIAGRGGSGNIAAYSASKSGAISITQSQASQLGRFNINVNAICPGLLWTDMWRKLEGMLVGDDADEVVDRRARFEAALAAACPLGREQTPEDIGKAVAFLVSDDARNITGQALNVDGGIRMN